MSDPTRKGFTEKVSENVKPQEQKSYLEQGKEYLTDSADKVQSKIHPEQDKSATQKVGDTLEGKSGGKQESWSETAQRYGEHAKEYAEQAREKINDTINSHTGGSSGGTHGPK
ncbi:ZYRO0F03696p [Zygosaccharomyces rouxii]|uniref:ZYRO0F03696p n=1 Tax=Zygosaccharomyces rouxii (strain ATCC 2623 / CBS 732 / NBRC 1130 / NCYC 568 / NRRL Y-229) TaxID=559307 RepID=C5DXB5_ZYGRC|nr:uncharacterized protein ZYRO0F03696g [Zygosaccharomyces rouxii]KAH9199189.1 heat shock protein 9/12-domain-containing protein [Zygosaccharomyces rouxii]CAR28426.1 ZYRO0F03696p [Zygosaccharomyces rouxii]